MGRDRLDLALGQSNKAGALDLKISTRETNGPARGSYVLTMKGTGKGAGAPVVFKGAIECEIE